MHSEANLLYLNVTATSIYIFTSTIFLPFNNNLLFIPDQKYPSSHHSCLLQTPRNLRNPLLNQNRHRHQPANQRQSRRGWRFHFSGRAAGRSEQPRLKSGLADGPRPVFGRRQDLAPRILVALHGHRPGRHLLHLDGLAGLLRK